MPGCGVWLDPSVSNGPHGPQRLCPDAKSNFFLIFINLIYQICRISGQLLVLSFFLLFTGKVFAELAKLKLLIASVW